jgi:hypothetical protein
MNSITLVYKTYKNDLPWLKYSLLSLKKFVSGYNAIVIYCEVNAIEDLNKIVEDLSISCQIIPVIYDFHGYIKQMIVKIESYKDIHTKYICILDSDNIFINAMNCNDLIKEDGKIEWVYTTIEDDPIGYPQWIIWKKAYEDMTRTTQDKHFMTNKFPFIFTRNSLVEASNKFKTMHGVGYSEFCKKRLNDLGISIDSKIVETFTNLATVFEEFEWIGYFCMNYSSDYTFIKLMENKKDYIKYYWSHGGITEEIKSELELLLNLNTRSP